MNAAADMLLAPETQCQNEAVLYASVCVCVRLSAGGEGKKKSHVLIRKSPSWPSALLQWEFD